MNSDFRKRVVFPAVTVCNSNRVRASQLDGTVYQSIAEMDNVMEQNGNMLEFDEPSDYLYNDSNDSIDYPYIDIFAQENVQRRPFEVSA